MKKNPIAALSLAVAFVAGGMFSVPVHEMMQHPESAKAAVSDTVPEGYIPIYTIEDLYNIGSNLNANYILMNDIDLSETAPGGLWDFGCGWRPIKGNGDEETGGAPFRGVFDGNGHAIKNMHIFGEPDPEDGIGLFATCGCRLNDGSGGLITRLALLDCDIDIDITNYDYSYCIGGIASSACNISDCYVTGNIKASAKLATDKNTLIRMGGICGGADSVDNCFSTCDISLALDLEDGESPDECNEFHDFSKWDGGEAEIQIGGISGYCQEHGNAKCNYNVGVISIIKGDQVTYNPMVCCIAGMYSYNMNVDADLQCCYYLKTDADYTASGYETDDRFTNVIGLTKDQMQTAAAYTGFDFDEVWTIDPNADYPYPTLRNVPYVSASEEQPTTDPTTEATEAPTYEPTAPASNPSSDSPQKGDINEDGFVNASDASIILIYAANIGAGNQVSIDDLY